MSDDHFADVRGHLSGYGVLGGDGADEVDSVKTLPLSKEGPRYQVRCQHCGQPNIITVSWDELVYVSANQQPQGWVYEPTRGAVRPNVGCGMCHVVLMVLFTPDECAKNLHAGEAAGYIQPGAAHAARQKILGAAQQYRR